MGSQKGPFGLTREAPHTYLTGACQQVEHSKQRTLAGKELDTFIFREAQRKQQATFEL